MQTTPFESETLENKTGFRKIVHSTKGHRHGPVTRLMSPGDLGQKVKPFVFLDMVELKGAKSLDFAMHPHSGIATLSMLVEGDLHFQRSDGEQASIASGGVEWMMAGGGAWHGGPMRSQGTTRGFQLWVALPPEWEHQQWQEVFLTAEDILEVGPARVLLGTYEGASSPITVPSPLVYLHVTLKSGEQWSFNPPAGHDVTWVAVSDGKLSSGEQINSGELAVFEPGEEMLSFRAISDVNFVLGSAVRHPYPLWMGYYSVHTNLSSLDKGEKRITELGEELRRQGRI